MFIKLTRVFYDTTIHGYITEMILIRSTNIVSVVDTHEYFGGYECRRIDLDNGKTHYVTESYEYIVNKMSAIANLMYNEEEDNDWK